MKLVLFMDKSLRNPSLSMKLVLFMDNCLLECSLSMELALFMDEPSGASAYDEFWDSVGR